jgi:hypothetical protein
MDDATLIELEAMKIEAMAFAELMMFDDNPEPKAEEIRRIATRIRALAVEKPGAARPGAEVSLPSWVALERECLDRRARSAEARRDKLWQHATGCDVPAEAAEKIGRLEARVAEERRQRLRLKTAHAFWKEATDCATPAEAQSTIFRLKTTIEEMRRDRNETGLGAQQPKAIWKTGPVPASGDYLIRERDGRFSLWRSNELSMPPLPGCSWVRLSDLDGPATPAVNVELLRRCYWAMQQCSNTSQLDSAAKELADAYPEVTSRSVPGHVKCESSTGQVTK